MRSTVVDTKLPNISLKYGLKAVGIWDVYETLTGFICACIFYCIKIH